MDVIMMGISMKVAIFLAALNYVGAIAFVLDLLIWHKEPFSTVGSGVLYNTANFDYGELMSR